MKIKRKDSLQRKWIIVLSIVIGLYHFAYILCVDFGIGYLRVMLFIQISLMSIFYYVNPSEDDKKYALRSRIFHIIGMIVDVYVAHEILESRHLQVILFFMVAIPVLLYDVIRIIRPLIKQFISESSVAED